MTGSTAAFGQKRSLAAASPNVRLWIRKRSFEPTSAAHKDLFVSNVSFAIRKRTFAATNLNDCFGSIPDLRIARFSPRRMSPLGYKRTLWGLARNVCFTPVSGHRRRKSASDSKSGHPRSAYPPTADVNGHGAGGPFLTRLGERQDKLAKDRRCKNASHSKSGH